MDENLAERICQIAEEYGAHVPPFAAKQIANELLAGEQDENPLVSYAHYAETSSSAPPFQFKPSMTLPAGHYVLVRSDESFYVYMVGPAGSLIRQTLIKAGQAPTYLLEWPSGSWIALIPPKSSHDDKQYEAAKNKWLENMNAITTAFGKPYAEGGYIPPKKPAQKVTKLTAQHFLPESELIKSDNSLAGTIEKQSALLMEKLKMKALSEDMVMLGQPQTEVYKLESGEVQVTAVAYVADKPEAHFMTHDGGNIINNPDFVVEDYGGNVIKNVEAKPNNAAYFYGIENAVLKNKHHF